MKKIEEVKLSLHFAAKNYLTYVCIPNKNKFFYNYKKDEKLIAKFIDDLNSIDDQVEIIKLIKTIPVCEFQKEIDAMLSILYNVLQSYIQKQIHITFSFLPENTVVNIPVLKRTILYNTILLQLGIKPASEFWQLNHSELLQDNSPGNIK